LQNLAEELCLHPDRSARSASERYGYGLVPSVAGTYQFTNLPVAAADAGISHLTRWLGEKVEERAMETPLVKMQKLGQSPWHDNIHRGLLTSGKLARMISQGDITGLTSNPTIFEQAISKSSDYDESFDTAVRAGKSPEQIFDTLAIEDIRSAAQAFRPVFERTNGADGFVSIEVAPKLAHDTRATIAEAQRLWRAVDKPNLMVKIPATSEGMPAIEQSIADGLNINVTLIFALERYEQVMDAYIAGLSRRVRMNQDISRIASVASFFVSRIDTAIDKLIEEKMKALPQNAAELERLFGKAGIANAKLAYQRFLKKFSSPQFAELAKKGARKQRPLWASTSVKNPSYPDTYYVEALVGPDTVDTMPPATIEAYRDHGNPEVRVDRDLDVANEVPKRLASFRIDLGEVTRKLEDEGVASFARSFDSLIAAVAARRDKHLQR
jgi:transaldolase